MNLTRNFTLSELIKSDTAIRRDINNNPNAEQVEKLKALCENILQPVRDHFGRVKITSGFRSVDLCLAIGSSANSQHAKAEAADFECPGVDNAELADWIYKNLEPDQLILEFYTPGEPNSGWIHCSWIPEGRRAQYMHAYKSEGKTKYKPVIGTARNLVEWLLVCLRENEYRDLGPELTKTVRSRCHYSPIWISPYPIRKILYPFF